MAGKTAADLGSMRAAGRGAIDDYATEAKKNYNKWVDAANSLSLAYATAYQKWKNTLADAARQKAQRDAMAATIFGLVLGSGFSWLALGIKTKAPGFMRLASNQKLNEALNERVVGDMLEVGKAIAGKVSKSSSKITTTIKPKANIGLLPSEYKAGLIEPLVAARQWFDDSTTELKNTLSDAWLSREIVKDGSRSLTELEEETRRRIKKLLQEKHQNKATYFKSVPVAPPSHTLLSRLIERSFWAAYIYQVHGPQKSPESSTYSLTTVTRGFRHVEDPMTNRLIQLGVIKPAAGKKKAHLEAWNPPIYHPGTYLLQSGAAWDHDELWQLWLWAQGYLQGTQVSGIQNGAASVVREPMLQLAPIPPNNKKKRVVASQLVNHMADLSIQNAIRNIRSVMTVDDAIAIVSAASSDKVFYETRTITNNITKKKHSSQIKQKHISMRELHDLKILLWRAKMDATARALFTSIIILNDAGVVTESGTRFH